MTDETPSEESHDFDFSRAEDVKSTSIEEIEHAKQYLIMSTVVILGLGVLYLLSVLVFISVGLIDLSAGGVMTPAEYRAQFLSFPEVLWSVASLGAAVVYVGVGLLIGLLILAQIYEWYWFASGHSTLTNPKKSELRKEQDR